MNHRYTLALCIAALVLATGQVGAARSDSAVTVDVGTDGDARWNVTNYVDLADDAEKNSFDDRFGREEARSRARDRLIAPFERLADRASASIDRGMTVENASLAATRNGDQGRVSLTFTWTSFAESTGDTVVVGDVFQGGLTLGENQSLAITGPGTVNASAAPEATVSGDTVRWTGPVEVSRDVTLTYAGGTGLPGMGAAAAVLAVAAAALLAGRRRSERE